jgi:hypothetical protein
MSEMCTNLAKCNLGLLLGVFEFFFYFYGTLVSKMYKVEDLKTSFNIILNPNFNSIYKGMCSQDELQFII